MLRRLQPVLLMAAVAVVFFFCGAKVETWFERPASARTVAAVKLPQKAAALPVKAAPAPVADEAPASVIESGVDPDTKVEFYQVKDLPEIEGQGHDVDMIDEPAAEAEAAPAPSDASAH